MQTKLPILVAVRSGVLVSSPNWMETFLLKNRSVVSSVAVFIFQPTIAPSAFFCDETGEEPIFRQTLKLYKKVLLQISWRKRPSEILV